MSIDLSGLGNNFQKYNIKANDDATSDSWVTMAVARSEVNENLFTLGWLDINKTREDVDNLHFLDFAEVEESTGFDFDKFHAHTNVDSDGFFAAPLLYDMTEKQVQEIALVSYAWAHKKTAEDFMKLAVQQATPRPDNVVSISDGFSHGTSVNAGNDEDPMPA